MNRRIEWIVLLLLFCLFTGLRIYRITADPPPQLSWSGGLYFDEGALVQNARNKLLFGTWFVDEWNDFYYSPLLSIQKYVWFKSVQIGITQVRLFSVFYGLASLFLFFLILNKSSFDKLWVYVGLIFLGVQNVFVFYNRIGLTETPLTFYLMLVLFFWLMCIRENNPKKRRIYAFLTGFSDFLAFTFKGTALVFLPVPFIAFVLQAYHWRGKNEESTKDLKTIFVFMFGGFLLCMVLWVVFFYIPFHGEFSKTASFVAQLSIPKNVSEIFRNIHRMPFFQIFLKYPILLLSSWFGLWFSVLFILSRRELPPVITFGALWFVAFFLFYLVYSYRPTRYFVPLIPPFILLALFFFQVLTSWNITEAFEKGLRIRITSWLFFMGVGVYICVPLCVSIYRHFVDHSARAHPVLVWVIGIIFGVILERILQPLFGRNLSVPSLALVVLFGISLFFNMSPWLQWASHPSYNVIRISREWKTILQSAWIAGLASPELTLETRHRALYVWPNFANDKNPFQKFPLTHLILGEFNGETEFYRKSFPHIMERAFLLKTYRIRGSRFYLYSIRKPFLKHVTVEPIQDETGQKIGGTYVLVNPDMKRVRGSLMVAFFSRHGQSKQPYNVSYIPFELPAESTLEKQFRIKVARKPERMFIGLSEPQHFILEGEELGRLIGENVYFFPASNHHVRRALRGEKGFLTYGPYERFSPGLYLVTFWVSVEKNTELRHETPLFILDVATRYGKDILASQTITAKDVKNQDGFQGLSLSFHIERPTKLEFRLQTTGYATIACDRVDVAYQEGFWFKLKK